MLSFTFLFVHRSSLRDTRARPPACRRRRLHACMQVGACMHACMQASSYTKRHLDKTNTPAAGFACYILFLVYSTHPHTHTHVLAAVAHKHTHIHTITTSMPRTMYTTRLTTTGVFTATGIHMVNIARILHLHTNPHI